MKKIINYAHLFLEELCDCNKTFIDFTLGNGHDSMHFFNKVKKLYAFDIQAIALQSALTNYPVLKKAHLICDNHFNFTQYIDYFDLGIFNLGYLPNADKNITTLASTTILTLDKAISRLNNNGRIVIVVYIGHKQGQIESEALLQYFKSNTQIKVSKFELLNRKLAPYILIIDK